MFVEQHLAYLPAGKIVRFRRGLDTSPRKLVKRRCICPAFSMLLLKIRIRPTISARETVFGSSKDPATELARVRGLSPKRTPKAIAPSRKAFPRDSFLRMAMSTSTNTMATRSSAGIWFSMVIRLACYGLRATSYELWVTGCVLRVARYGLRVMSYELRVARYGLFLPHSALRIPHSAFRIPNSAFQFPHSIHSIFFQLL